MTEAGEINVLKDLVAGFLSRMLCRLFAFVIGALLLAATGFASGSSPNSGGALLATPRESQAAPLQLFVLILGGAGAVIFQAVLIRA